MKRYAMVVLTALNPRDLAHLNIFALMFHGAGVWLEYAL